MVSVQNNPLHFLVLTMCMCLDCQKSEWWALRCSCSMSSFSFDLKTLVLSCPACVVFTINLSKTSILTTLAGNFNESLLELAYFHAESAVKSYSREKAEWGRFAGQLVLFHTAMIPIPPAHFHTSKCPH